MYFCKTVIKYYNNFCSPVYSCFLDASKAFDRMNHWTLCKKIINRSIPSVILRILIYWYKTQFVCIKWGHCIFVYVHDLSHALYYVKVGCLIDNVCMNHLISYMLMIFVSLLLPLLVSKN